MLEQDGTVVAQSSGGLLAYQIDEGFEGESAIVFATHRTKAKSDGAAELGLNYVEIQSCRRVPELDAYAPGPVPPLVLFQRGWWFECAHCTQPIRPGQLADDAQPCEANGWLYCTPNCRALRHALERRSEAAEAALIELVTTRYPAATQIRTRVVNGILQGEDGTFGGSWATFRLPEFKHPVAYQFGHPGLVVSGEDQARYLDLYHPREILS